jgi:hypothetical protein
MFDMKRHAGDGGYQLRITYLQDPVDKFALTGYLVYPDDVGEVYDRDGRVLLFDSLEEVLKHLTEAQ